MERGTETAHPMPEMTSTQEPSAFDRVRNAVVDAFDRSIHPVSREAETQLLTIATQLEGTPVAATLEQIEPHLRGMLRGADARALIGGMFWRGIMLALGGSFLQDAFRQNRRVHARVYSGLLGGIGIAGGLALRLEGSFERDRIQERSSRLMMFYATDAGKADAANPDKTSAQVDSIVRAITAGYVPSVSRP